MVIQRVHINKPERDCVTSARPFRSNHSGQNGSADFSASKEAPPLNDVAFLLRKAAEYPLLSAMEERSLATQIRNGYVARRAITMAKPSLLAILPTIESVTCFRGDFCEKQLSAFRAHFSDYQSGKLTGDQYNARCTRLARVIEDQIAKERPVTTILVDQAAERHYQDNVASLRILFDSLASGYCLDRDALVLRFAIAPSFAHFAREVCELRKDRDPIRLQRALGFLQASIGEWEENRLAIASHVIRMHFECLRIGQFLDPLKERFLNSNIRLVVSIAKRYVGKGLSLPDLIAAGNDGAYGALLRFNPNNGFRFSTYATNWIEQSIERALDYDVPAVRVPENGKSDWRDFHECKSRLSQSLGTDPSTEEIRRELGWTPQRFRDVRFMVREQRSLDAPVPGGKSSSKVSTYIGTLQDRSSQESEEHSFSDQTRDLIARLPMMLGDRNAAIVGARLGIPLGLNGELDAKVLESGEGLPLKEIARCFKIARERVRQISDKASLYLQQFLFIRSFEPKLLETVINHSLSSHLADHVRDLLDGDLSLPNDNDSLRLRQEALCHLTAVLMSRYFLRDKFDQTLKAHLDPVEEYVVCYVLNGNDYVDTAQKGRMQGIKLTPDRVRKRFIKGINKLIQSLGNRVAKFVGRPV